jgi:ABC-type nitrate/sulfonate/bicarbonate transport system substrate-binding protein
VPGATNLQFLSLWVAIGSGVFEAEGLRPEVLVAPMPRSVGNRLFAGDADVAVLPPPMFLGMMAEAKPVRLFASLLANEPINLVLRKDVAAARNFPPRAPLKEKLAAFQGLKVGLAGEVSPRLRTLFATADLDAEKELTLVTIAGSQQVGALARGEVDLLFSHTPYLETALVEHDAVLVVDASSGEIPALADGQIHALATTREIASERSPLIHAVTRAIARAQRLIHSDAAAGLAALRASGAATGEPRLTAAILAVYGLAVPATPRISIDGIRRAREIYPAHPRHPDFSVVNPADFVAAEFAAAVGPN